VLDSAYVGRVVHCTVNNIFMMPHAKEILPQESQIT
jgi:hypothetical protein